MRVTLFTRYWRRRFWAWYNGRPAKAKQSLKALAVILATYVFIALVFVIVRSKIDSKSANVMSPYQQSNIYVGKAIEKASPPVLGNGIYHEIFGMQQKVINERREHHYRMAMIFFRNYYSVTVCLIIVSCLSGLVLFALVSNGWTESAFTLKALFLSLASAAIFMSLFANVFSQQKNFEDNMLRYMDYTKTELHLSQQMSQLSKADFPKRFVDPDSTVIIDTIVYFRSLDTLIARNNATINNLTNYIFTIDAARLKSMAQSYQELLEMQRSTQDTIP